MMETTNPRIRSLLRQAQHIADSGKRAAAERLYRQITEEAPEEPAGWLGLAGLLRDPEAKQAIYERVLALDPMNDEATRALRRQQKDSLVEEPPVEKVEPDAFNQSRDWLQQETARRHFDDILDGNRSKAAAAEVETEPLPVSNVAKDAAATPEIEGDEADEVQLYCYRHSGRPTSLRCISCGNPICSKCAQHTPVGYRCPVCIREAQDVYYSATMLDYILAFVVSLPLSLLAGYVVVWILGGGFLMIILMLFLGGAAGSFIGRVAHRVVGRRRGRRLPHLVAAMIVLGVLLPALPVVFAILLGNFGAIAGLIVPALYLFVATSAAFYTMR